MTDNINRQILVTDENSQTQALFLGVGGQVPAGYTNPFLPNRVRRYGFIPQQQIRDSQRWCMCPWRQVPDNLNQSDLIPGQTGFDTFLNSMLDQLRTETPTYPESTPSGVTDVRLYDVLDHRVSSGRNPHRRLAIRQHHQSGQRHNVSRRPGHSSYNSFCHGFRHHNHAGAVLQRQYPYRHSHHQSVQLHLDKCSCRYIYPYRHCLQRQQRKRHFNTGEYHC